MAILQKINSNSEAFSGCVARNKSTTLLIPLNSIAMSRRMFVVGAGAAVGFSSMPTTPSHAGFALDLIEALVSVFGRIENLLRDAADFANKIGVELQAFRDDLRKIHSENAIASAYLETNGSRETSGIVKQNVYAFLPHSQLHSNGGSRQRIFKTIPTEMVTVRPNFTTSLPIHDPLTPDEKKYFSSNKQEAWLKLQTAVGETDGVLTDA